MGKVEHGTWVPGTSIPAQPHPAHFSGEREEANMFSCCLRVCEGSGPSEGHDHVSRRWVSPRSGRLWRFCHRIPKVTQGNQGQVKEGQPITQMCPGSTKYLPERERERENVCVSMWMLMWACVLENSFQAVFTFQYGDESFSSLMV
jgi:hypothetical protein